LDVLQNTVSVSVPFYRTVLFRLLPAKNASAMQGDPDPVAWVIASAFHWVVAAAALSYLFLSNPKLWDIDLSKQKGR
jgi:hypothetical protein